MPHRETFEVRYADVDMMGHVNNATYLTYFETARLNYYMRLRDLQPPLGADDLDIIVARLACQYHRGLRWKETAEIVAWVDRVGTKSFTVRFAILDAHGKLVAEGDTVLVSYDYAQDASKEIPPDLRRLLEQEKAQGPGVDLPLPRA